MNTSYLSSNFGFSACGSDPIRVRDSCNCFNGRLQKCGLNSPCAVSCYSCCCALCVHRVNLSSSLVYGLKQSSLLQWSGGRRLVLGGAGGGLYSSLCCVDRVDSGFECCAGDTRKVWSFDRVEYVRRRKSGIKELGIVGRREWQRYAGGLSEAEDLIDLLADNVTESMIVSIETKVVRPRRKKEEKMENVCDECSRRKMEISASGSSRGKSRRDELTTNEMISKGDRWKRDGSLRSEKMSELRTSGGSGSLQRKLRHKEFSRADIVSKSHGRNSSEDVSVSNEKHDKLRKEGSGCSLYYSLSSSEGVGSDEEVEKIVELESNKFVEEQLRKNNKEFRNQNDDESYELVVETERCGQKQQEIQRSETKANGSHEGNVVWDRKKSEKKLVDTVMDQSQSVADTSKKRLVASDAYISSYNKSDVSHMQFQSSSEISSSVMNRKEERIHSDTTDSTEVSRSKRRNHNESRFEEIHVSDALMNSSQVVQSSVQQDGISMSTVITHDTKKQRGQDLVGRSSQQYAERLRIQEVDDTSKVSESRLGKQSTSVQTAVQESKEDYSQHISALAETDIGRRSEQITNISETNRSETQITSILNQQIDSRIKIGEGNSGLASGMTGKIRESGHEDLQGVQSRKGSRVSIESSIQNSGLTTATDSATTSLQVVLASDERAAEENRYVHNQHDECYKQIEVKREQQRLARETSLGKRTIQSSEMPAAYQLDTGGSLSKMPTTSYVYERASKDENEDRYSSQHLRQQGQYLTSEWYGGYTRDDGSEDLLGSAERMEKSSSILIEEFVEQAKGELSASEVQKEKLKKTKAENDDLKKQAMVKYGSAGGELTSLPHSEEKLDVVQSSVDPPPTTKTSELSPKAGNTPVKRTGRSLWNVIGNVVRARWVFRGESSKSPSKSQKRSSSNESASSEAWFSSHEHDENLAKEAERISPFQESASPSYQVVPEEEHNKGRLAGSDAVEEIDKQDVSGSSSTTGFSGSSTAREDISLVHEVAKPSSSGPEPSILATFSGPGIRATSASFPSRQLSRSTAIGSASFSARNDPSPTTSNSVELIGQQSLPLRLSEAPESEEKEGQLSRRKFQRAMQLPRDKFEEWEEALKRENEQHKIDDIFMREALVEAQKAADNWEVPVGAVLVQHGKIIARGRNLVEELRDSTAHAEMMCIRDASNALRTWRLAETTLYVTLEPCAMCAGAILQARVTTLVWGAPNKLLGADGSWIRLFPDDGERDERPDLADKPPAPVHPFHPKMNIRRGILSAECAQVMQHFFQLRRQNRNKSPPSSPPPSCLPVSTKPAKLITKVHGLFGSTLCL